METPTVKVTNDADPGGYMVINESDFDAAVHTLWTEPGEAAAATEKKSRAKAQG